MYKRQQHSLPLNFASRIIIPHSRISVSYTHLKYVDDVEFYAEDAGQTDNEYLARVVEAVIKAEMCIRDRR